MSGYRWSRRQVLLIHRLAGQMTLARMAQRISAAGPTRSPDAVRRAAQKRGIDWQGGGNTTRRWLWTSQEDDLLRALAGQASDAAITEALNTRFRTQRRVGTVRRRACTIGISLLRCNGIGMTTLAATLAISTTRLHREVAADRLRADVQGNGRKGTTWLFLPADVEAWIRANPFALDWRRVKAGRWRDFVRSVALRDPYLSISEIETRLDVPRKLIQAWVRQGEVGGIRDIGTPLKPIYRIPLRSLDQITRLAHKGVAA